MRFVRCRYSVRSLPFDKQDIIDIAEKINTFETSILPYEDCCTTFVAKHPVTKPDLERIEKSETHLSEKMDEMFETAVTTREIIKVSPDSGRIKNRVGDFKRGKKSKKKGLYL